MNYLSPNGWSVLWLTRSFYLLVYFSLGKGLVGVWHGFLFPERWLLPVVQQWTLPITSQNVCFLLFIFLLIYSHLSLFAWQELRNDQRFGITDGTIQDQLWVIINVFWKDCIISKALLQTNTASALVFFFGHWIQRDTAMESDKV